MRMQIPPELLPRLIAILGDAIWFAFAVGLSLMIAGVAIGFSMASPAPAKTEKPLKSNEC
jgi:F0F1-type ATP synthase membrane subunit c/vacuolar-type H+-ATPase subunit K